MLISHVPLPGWLGEAPGRPIGTFLTPLLGVRFVVGEVLDVLVHQIVTPMSLLVPFLLLTSVLRRQWAAALVVVAFFGFNSPAGNEHWLQVPLSLLFIAIALFTVVRVGLVAGVAAAAISALFFQQPITTDLVSRTAGSTIAVLAILGLSAGYGFLISLGGQSPFGEGCSGIEVACVKFRKSKDPGLLRLAFLEGQGLFAGGSHCARLWHSNRDFTSSQRQRNRR